MILFFQLLFFFPAFTFAQTSVNLSEQNLEKRWHNEEIYFLPSNPQSFAWQGEVFDYSNETCIKVADHQPNTPSVKPVKCSAKILKKAKFKYKKIKNFQTFRSLFLNCLRKYDKNCLRPFISKTLMISFGIDDYGDRRDLVFKKWNNKDLDEMRKLIEAGVIDHGTTKTFPPLPSDGGVGQRGEFKLIDGGWRLNYYLAGD